MLPIAVDGFAVAEGGKLACVLARAGMTRAGFLAEGAIGILLASCGVVWRGRYGTLPVRMGSRPRE